MTDAVKSSRSREGAHRDAIQVSQNDLVSALTDKLGVSLVALIANKDKSTISRWKSSTTIDESALRPLRSAYQIIKLLEGADADATIRAWFMGSNPQLDDVSPAEALSAGAYREALAAARSFMAGG